MMARLDIKQLRKVFKFFIPILFLFLSWGMKSETINSQPTVQDQKGISLPAKKLEFKNSNLGDQSLSRSSQRGVLKESEEFDPLPEDLKEKVTNDQNVVEASPDLDSKTEEDREIELQIKQRIKTYTYDPVSRKDPFTRPGDLDVSLDITPDSAIHPVEKESIGDLKLKAIIWSNDGVIPRALFETKDGKAYTLSKNDRIGNQGAIIYRVDINRVWYMKPFIDPTTKQVGYKPNEITLDAKRENKEGLWYER